MITTPIVTVACDGAIVSGPCKLLRTTAAGVTVTIIADNPGGVSDLERIIGEACTPKAWTEQRRKSAAGIMPPKAASIPPPTVRGCEAMRKRVIALEAEVSTLRKALYAARRNVPA